MLLAHNQCEGLSYPEVVQRGINGAAGACCHVALTFTEALGDGRGNGLQNTVTSSGAEFVLQDEVWPSCSTMVSMSCSASACKGRRHLCV